MYVSIHKYTCMYIRAYCNNVLFYNIVRDEQVPNTLYQLYIRMHSPLPSYVNTPTDRMTNKMTVQCCLHELCTLQETSLQTAEANLYLRSNNLMTLTCSYHNSRYY